jgi:hypothetical protein
MKHCYSFKLIIFLLFLIMIICKIISSLRIVVLDMSLVSFLVFIGPYTYMVPGIS